MLLSSPSTRRAFVAIALEPLVAAAACWASSARAQTPTPTIDLSTPVDYDAPDPTRDSLRYVRSFANLTFGNYVMFQIDWFRGVDWIYDTRDSIGRNVSSRLQLDYDPLSEDLLGHPLHGSLDFNAARAAGLSFWESAIFPALGAAEWELIGERQEFYDGGWRSKPSTNDFVSTATAGILLGEMLFRLSSVVLDESSTGGERALREIAGTLLDPMRGFNRFYDGDMWKSGPPPLRLHPVSLALDLGTDRLRGQLLSSPVRYSPTALVAFEMHYGDLLPTKKDETLDPLEYFEAYAAVNLFDHQLSGTQVYGQGLLYGWSHYLSGDQGALRDNNVIGIAQTFDYQGANIAKFAAMSIGPSDFVEWRYGPRRRLRLGVDAEWTYLAATESPFDGNDSDHNFAMGVSFGASARLEAADWGNISLRSRNYLTAVVDGRGDQEVIGYARLAYDVDVAPHVGLGIAPSLIYRRSTQNAQTFRDAMLESQLFIRLHD